MIISREQLEERECQTLAPYAIKSSESRGRDYTESTDPYRTCFQHDRDRVIHSKAFRRLKGKTQVFVAHYGDHYRSRLTHTMEVAQLSRDVARMLNVNEDLAETIALAHDLGHTPFGHMGQETMNSLMREFSADFEHNEQSKRVVEYLEEKKPEFKGLNLTFEVRDGLIKHRTAFDKPKLTDTFMPSLEAQIVNVADEIAYLNHDIDDGLRSGIITLADLDNLSIWQKVKQTIKPEVNPRFRISSIISALIGIMVEDLAKNTDKLIRESEVKKPEDIYSLKKPLSSFSKELSDGCVELKAFLYNNFYRSSGVSAYNAKGQEVIRFLFKKLMDNFNLIPENIRIGSESGETHIMVKDYIAGMTDQFALDLYDKLSN